MEIQYKDYTPENVRNLINRMCETDGYKIFINYLNLEREKIILDGKRSRTNESQIKNWAKLDGFDKCIEIINKLRNSRDEKESSFVEAEDE